MSNTYYWCPRCKDTTPCDIHRGPTLVIWSCRKCNYVFDEEYIDDECDSMAGQQAELEEWGEL